jgi:hypothetical protein
VWHAGDRGLPRATATADPGHADVARPLTSNPPIPNPSYTPFSSVPPGPKILLESRPAFVLCCRQNRRATPSGIQTPSYPESAREAILPTNRGTGLPVATPAVHPAVGSLTTRMAHNRVPQAAPGSRSAPAAGILGTASGLSAERSAGDLATLSMPPRARQRGAWEDDGNGVRSGSGRKGRATIAPGNQASPRGSQPDKGEPTPG